MNASVSEVAIDALCESLSHKTKVGGATEKKEGRKNLRVHVDSHDSGWAPPRGSTDGSSSASAAEVAIPSRGTSGFSSASSALTAEKEGEAAGNPSSSGGSCSPVVIPVNTHGLYSNLERFIVEATPVVVAQCASADEVGNGMISPDGSSSSMTSEAAEALDQGSYPPLQRSNSETQGVKEDAAVHAMEMDGSGSEYSSKQSSSRTHISRSPSMKQGGDASIMLGDLWEAYREWSAFGLAVPLTLMDGSECEQCFIPYLSSLHIYEGRHCTRRMSITPSDNSEMDDEEMSDSCSMTSCSNSANGSDDATPPQDWSSKGEVLVPRFQYAETAQPGARIPLYEKLRQLQLESPVDIFNLRTDDIHSMSWMAIAWYPICMIPANSLKASTSFLTFHSLHVGDKSANLPVFFRKDLAPEGPPLSPRAAQGLHNNVSAWKEEHCGCGDVVAMRCFGCTSYKMASAVWLGKYGEGRDLSIQLHSATSFWLKRVKAKQHDHAFFTRKLARCSSNGSSDGERGYM